MTYSPKPKRLSERRQDVAPVIDGGERSKDPAYLNAKIHERRKAIVALEAKIKRLEDALRSGMTWNAYRRLEAARAEERHQHWREKTDDVGR